MRHNVFLLAPPTMTYKVLSRTPLITSPYCPVEKQVVVLPDGSEADWYVNTSADAVVVIPFLPSGEILLQRIYKHGSGTVITEFCAGLVDEGEVPVDAAQRELREETGHEGTLINIGSCFANPTGSTMKYHFFVAQNCAKVGDQQLDPAEEIELFTVADLSEARSVFRNKSVFTSAATLAAIGLCDDFLSGQTP